MLRREELELSEISFYLQTLCSKYLPDGQRRIKVLAEASRTNLFKRIDTNMTEDSRKSIVQPLAVANRTIRDMKQERNFCLVGS